MTLDAVSPGRYRVRFLEPGFERWRRSLAVDGARNDTVWASLRPTTRARGVLRSLAFPGWGQFYDKRPAAGWFYGTTAVLAFGASVVAQVKYSDRIDEVRRARTPEESEAALREADDARDIRNLLQGGMVGVWGISILDAAFLSRPGAQGARAGVRVGFGGSPQGMRVAATVGF